MKLLKYYSSSSFLSRVHDKDVSGHSSDVLIRRKGSGCELAFQLSGNLAKSWIDTDEFNREVWKLQEGVHLVRKIETTKVKLTFRLINNCCESIMFCSTPGRENIRSINRTFKVFCLVTSSLFLARGFTRYWDAGGSGISRTTGTIKETEPKGTFDFPCN